MEAKSSYDIAIAGIQDRNVKDTVTGVLGMVADITHADGVRLKELQTAEDELRAVVESRLHSVYDLSIAHSFPVRPLRAESDAEPVLTVFLSPSFHGDGIPEDLRSNGTIFASVEPAPSLRIRYANVGVENWQMVQNREAGRNRRRLVRSGEAYYHNRAGSMLRVPTHKQAYRIEQSGVGVRLEVTRLRRKISGLPEVYQGELGEWMEQYPVPAHLLEPPVQTLSTNHQMDAVFGSLHLYRLGLRTWDYASEARYIRGIVLLEETPKFGQTTRLQRLST